MQKDDTLRVSDPIEEYDSARERHRYRVITRGGGRPRRSRIFETERQAWVYVTTWRADLARVECLTVEEALDEYLTTAGPARGWSKEHALTTGHRLRGLLAPQLPRPLPKLTAAHLTAAYRAYQTGRAVATHRAALNQCKTFFGWCLKQGLLKESPAAGLEGEGRRRRGKVQLRTVEARTWVQHAALRYLRDGEEGALAALLCLLLGLRSKEARDRRVRDVDEGVLVIERTKTDGGARRLEIPEQLRPLLARQVTGKSATDWLFGGTTQRHRGWVLDWTQRLCRECGVTEVCAQSLRGLHATIAVTHGVSAHVVAGSLGHSPAVMRAHYAAPGSEGTGQSRSLLRVIEGGAHPSPTRPPGRPGRAKRRKPPWFGSGLSARKKRGKKECG
jgi:integrase